ncbi:MAG: hypothetical protein KBB37_04945 [Bacteroidia bacterium]|jgi:hypothetical protein|nr:hypothetical protein [Bacteroidia bacterium]MBP9179875.1 hypothetical protein [Bacteroidia bacterium]MBP9724237.1 hypothetical protein [Bacteroidia bacterium]
MENKVTAPTSDASSIYEGGDITQISADQLKGNIVAIRQLINEHNLTVKESIRKDTEIQKLTSEVEYLKTSPFVSIASLVINIIGTIIIGLSSEKIGNELQVSNGDISTQNGWFLFSGIILIILGSLMSILYPYARGWFNKKQRD